MRFKEFLLENDAEDFQIEKFAKDCHQFLSDIKGIKASNIPVRGQKAAGTGDWDICDTKNARASVHTDRELHNALNDFFEMEFNWRARENNALFISGDIRTANMYGTEYACFPIGQYQSLWSPNVTDLFADVYSIKTWIPKNPANLDEDDIDKIVSIIASYEWFHNSELQKGLSTVNEIILGCKQYYVIKLDSKLYKEVVLPFLKSEGIVK